MASGIPFTLIYAPRVKEHLKTIEAKYYSLIRKAIQRQLRFEPNAETKNRKPLKRPGVFGSAWEIRFGPDNRFRVFYEVDRESRQVFILAVGQKIGNRLSIGREEFET
jgi:mRNA-degrading endonuclease RelE of RelBE toxin-antitoxin system